MRTDGARGGPQGTHEATPGIRKKAEPTIRHSSAYRDAIVVALVLQILTAAVLRLLLDGGTLALLRMYCSFGNVREVLETGMNERRIGRVPSSVLGGEAAPKSNSSHSPVIASPFGSRVMRPKLSPTPIWA